mgnify:CR=1 FL=1
MNLQALFSTDKTDLIASLIIFLTVVALTMSSRLFRLTSQTSLIFEEATEITFTELSNLDDLETVLHENKVYFNSEELRWAANLLGWKRFQRGRYEFEGSYSYNSVLSKMTRGIQDPNSVVVLPGITLERFSQSVSDHFYFEPEDLEDLFSDSTFLAKKNLSSQELFGRMLPETYLMYWTNSPKNVVNRILQSFERKFTEDMLNKASGMGYSLNEIITLASIVEWEAKAEKEKSKISGLYWNRLKRGMRLQADPTVNYALGERRRLLFEDYQFDHPYNTYVNDGLPPGPITNPSLSTIKATLNYEDHDYLYMVASPGGGHVFSESFREHQIASEEWRKWLREQYRIKRQNEAANQNSNENS